MITTQIPVALTDAPVIIAPAELPSITTSVDSLEEMKVIVHESFAEALLPQRERGDQMNGFLLCVLISKSAKRIKFRAEKIGVSLPISTVMRSVMCAYQLAAKDESGPFNESKPDFVRLMKLDEKIFRNELARHVEGKVKK